MKLNISVNSGAAFLIYALGVVVLTLMAGHNQAVERIYATALGGWTGGFTAYLVKRNANHKADAAILAIEKGAK
jgi:hypothetical protein